MNVMQKILRPATALSMLLSCAPALAAEPPPLALAVRAMLEAAIASDNAGDIAAVAKIATQTNPDARAEIAAMVNAHDQKKEAQRVARLRDAGMLELWKGSVELGGFRSTGVTDEIGISAGFTLARQGLKWSHKLAGSADYRRANGATSRERFVLTYEPRYQFDPSGFAYGLTQFERDPFLGYDSRFTGSAGVGYKLIQKKTMDMSVDIGPSLRFADYVDGHRETRLGTRSSVDYGIRLSPTVNFRENASIYIEDGIQSVNSLSAIDMRFGPRLSTRLSYTVQSEADTRVSIDNLTTLSKVTLLYAF